MFTSRTGRCYIHTDLCHSASALLRGAGLWRTKPKPESRSSRRALVAEEDEDESPALAVKGRDGTMGGSLRIMGLCNRARRRRPVAVNERSGVAMCAFIDL